MIDEPHIDLTDHPPPEARDVLMDLNRRLLGDPQVKPLALRLTSADGAIVGGMWARTGFQWLFVELMFVPRVAAWPRAAAGTARPGGAGSQAPQLHRGLARDIQPAGPDVLRTVRLHHVGEIADYPPGTGGPSSASDGIANHESG
ncbi:MAG TPA: hypothetical protein VK630_16935 [Reyranella sp.]|nr:hypothetical protein [Reyranella sp.]